MFIQIETKEISSQLKRLTEEEKLDSFLISRKKVKCKICSNVP